MSNHGVTRREGWRAHYGHGALLVGFGALAIGAAAIGALAIGSLAIGELGIGRARIKRLEIDDLVVGRIGVAPREQRRA